MGAQTKRRATKRARQQLRACGGTYTNNEDQDAATNLAGDLPAALGRAHDTPQLAHDVHIPGNLRLDVVADVGGIR